MGGVLTGSIVALVGLGLPLFVVIGVFALVCFLAYPAHPLLFGESVAGTLQNVSFIEPVLMLAKEPAIVAIPFYMFAGALMSRGHIAQGLVNFSNALLGWLPGGLGLTTVLACMLFAAISGSSPVTVITIGAIMLPALEKAGYPEKMGLGLVTSAGSLGIIIPPSIPMIALAIFSTQAGVMLDAGDLFIAGIGPGILIGALLMGYCMWKGRHIPREKFDRKVLSTAFLDGIWALFFPLFILGGIYTHIFTHTEASAIAVLVALVIELFIHRSIKVSEVPGIVVDTVVLMGSILVIVAIAFAFADFMAIQQVPDAIVRWLRGFDMTSLEFILMLNLLLLVVGCVMDIISAIVLFIPLVMPVGQQFGFDPVHLGLIFIVNLEIGYLTPPLGLNLFVASSAFKKSLGLVLRSVVPFLLILVGGLALVTFLPSLSTGFVNMSRDQPFWQSFPDTKLEAKVITEEDEELADEEDLDFRRTKPKSKGDADGASEAEDDGGEKSIEDLMKGDDFADEMSEGEDEDDGAEKSIEDLMKGDDFADEMGKDSDTEPSPQPATPATPAPGTPENEPAPDEDGAEKSVKDLMNSDEFAEEMGKEDL